ncbi:unnamed protein product [Linum trigynum]|uniref:Uncharacterized protein n=1 Tax=Linum trigynum TaxID=586398 RepID=A0AAV2FTR9_9ROSI
MEEETTEEVDEDIIMEELEGTIMKVEAPKEPLPEVQTLQTEEGAGSVVSESVTKKDDAIQEPRNPQGSNEKQVIEKVTVGGMRGNPKIENNGKGSEYSEQASQVGEQSLANPRNTSISSVGDTSSTEGGKQEKSKKPPANHRVCNQVRKLKQKVRGTYPLQVINENSQL